MRKTMRKNAVKGNEEGFVLILSLVAIVSMSLLGLSIIMSTTTDVQLARNEREAKQAFHMAESGMNEAMARLSLATTDADYIGELAADTGYRTLGWNASNAVGKDFGYNYGGNRNSVDNLNYTVSIRYLDESNIEGFCDSNDVDPNDSGNASSPPASCDSSPAEIVFLGRDYDFNGWKSYGEDPLYVVTSTGVSGVGPTQTTRTIVSYLSSSRFNPDIDNAISTNDCLDVSGGAGSVSGPVVIMNHCAGANSCASLEAGIVGAGECSTKTDPDDMNAELGFPLEAIKEMADETHACVLPNCADPGDDIGSSGQIGGVITDWGASGSERIIYIDNLGGEDAVITGNEVGYGALIVTGDLRISGTLDWHGLVYVMGAVRTTGGGAGLTIDGALMGNSLIEMTGTVDITYNPLTLDWKDIGTSAFFVWKRL